MPTAPRSFRTTTPEKLRGNRHQRGYGNDWYALSKMYRQQHPVCEVCHAAATDDVDHKIPFRGINDPLRLDVTNLRAVCRSCHNRKTHGRGGG